MKKYIEKLQFITHDIPQHTHTEQAQLACEAGAKWIQYRCFTKTDAELLQEINVIAEICDDWGATLIVTDHIHLKDKADIQGFHIEDMNADFIALRSLIGEEYTLGGSANSLENLIRLANEGADYAGFGPFSITKTKPNNAPMLGFRRIDAAAREQHFHGNVVGNIARQFDGCGISHCAGVDFGQGEGCMFSRNNNIASNHDFKATPKGEAVYRADNGLVKTLQFLQATKATDTVIGVRCFALSRRFQIPPGAEKLSTR